jgi:hypothetical protein
METQLPPAASAALSRTFDARLAPPSAPNPTHGSLHSSPRISPLPAAHLPDVEKPASASLSGAGDDAWTLYEPDPDPDKDERAAADSHALSILVSPDRNPNRVRRVSDRRLQIYLSGPCVLLSLALALWTLAALLASTLLLPLSILRPRCFRANLAFLLAPALRLHLACVRAPGPPASEAAPSTLSLTAVLLLAPLVAAAAAAAAWTAGFFWFFACVVGNPEGPPDDGGGGGGREGRRRGGRARRRDEERLRPRRRADDGRGAVLWVRKRWKAWLAGSYEARR